VTEIHRGRGDGLARRMGMRRKDPVRVVVVEREINNT